LLQKQFFIIFLNVVGAHLYAECISKNPLKEKSMTDFTLGSLSGLEMIIFGIFALALVIMGIRVFFPKKRVPTRRGAHRPGEPEGGDGDDGTETPRVTD